VEVVVVEVVGAVAADEEAAVADGDVSIGVSNAAELKLGFTWRTSDVRFPKSHYKKQVPRGYCSDCLQRLLRSK
jgi:hypothetical protein